MTLQRNGRKQFQHVFKFRFQWSGHPSSVASTLPRENFRAASAARRSQMQAVPSREQEARHCGSAWKKPRSSGRLESGPERSRC